VVVGMVSNGFTIADPTDPGMLDVVGFDASAPNTISDFSAGLV
jgi:60 kDa SS-A/Ro ribonucleoprotein